MSAAAAACDRVDLSHIDTWLFDLDNTLYPLESGLAVLMSAKITDFVRELTGLPYDEAHVLQKRYLADYGLTLAGLLAHHGVDPDAYHAMFRDVPLSGLTRDQILIAALGRLPGRRIIFTNADDGHAARVLDHLGMAELFDEVFHIASADFSPKPSPQSFERIIAAHAIVPAATAFFEDSERNLAPAAALGMTTILVGSAALGEGRSAHLRAANLAAFLTGARLKGQP